MDYSKITDNPKVIELLKQRIELENKIKAIDETALIKHELELLSLTDVVKSFYCWDEQALGKERRCQEECETCASVRKEK
jgi:hypothetical protein|tara:strand:+ start:331 stop:570 length:240 start_codon:yes stop_codon:yes gene_type:complete